MSIRRYSHNVAFRYAVSQPLRVTWFSDIASVKAKLCCVAQYSSAMTPKSNMAFQTPVKIAVRGFVNLMVTISFHLGLDEG